MKRLSSSSSSSQPAVKRARPGSVSAADQPPSDRAKLKFIFERYNHYASGTDNSPASALALRMLQHSVKLSDADSPKCMLCLETVQKGDAYTVLPCGHVFHQGNAACDGHESDSSAEEGEGGRCKGIIYWLNSNCACPTCRHELDRKFKRPSEEERLLIPIIKHQNSSLRLQEQLVQVQRRELITLRKEVRAKSAGNGKSAPKLQQNERSYTHTVRPVLSKETKKEILVCVINSLGNNVTMNVDNLEMLSVIVSKVEREILEKAGVRPYTLESDTLRSLIKDSLKTIKEEKSGTLLDAASAKLTEEESKAFDSIPVRE